MIKKLDKGIKTYSFITVKKATEGAIRFCQSGCLIDDFVGLVKKGLG